jgi:hypothetical protein
MLPSFTLAGRLHVLDRIAGGARQNRAQGHASMAEEKQKAGG